MTLKPWVTPLRLVYRDWLLQLARQEADAGCPNLFAMKSEVAMYFADLTATWDAERRYNLMCARIKWLFTGNYGFPAIPISEHEAAASARWKPWTPARTRTTAWDPAAPESVLAAERYREEQRGAYKIDKPRLKRALNRAMRERFGKGSGGGYYTTQIGDLTVSTTLDFGVRCDQFEYMQVRTHQLDRLLSHGGILTLLGEPQTRWGRLTNDDIPATAELVARICGELVAALPQMLERCGSASMPGANGSL